MCGAEVKNLPEGVQRVAAALEAALALLESPEWQAQLSDHCGDLAH